MAGGGWASMVPWSDIIQSNTDTYTNTMGTQTTRKDISQEGLNKLVYDVLAADSGLASLASGENLSGGFGSSVKSQLAQDMTIKLAGELANLTAATTTSSSTDTDQDKQSPLAKGIGTIICTHMMERGLVSKRDWVKGNRYNLELPNQTIIGYQFWAEPIVAHMKQNPGGWVEKFWLPIVKGRYAYTVHGKKNILGMATVFIMEPVSQMIGILLGVPNGRYADAV